MSYASRRELLARVVPRYRETDYRRKPQILDEFVASTGYARKYAIRLLTQPLRAMVPVRRPRPRAYGPLVQEALVIAWTATNGICGKRLVPFLPELVPVLERHGHLCLAPETRTQLLAISAATVDRILRPLREEYRPRGISTTRAGKLLKHQIPVRIFADWEDVRPGFFEADLVAHCGPSAEGSFLCTLVVTDVATGWTECLPLLYRSQETVIQALTYARQLLPFPMLGLDTDNGSEFLNGLLLEYTREAEITFTRGRAYKKNDQCFVEQKNGVVVRQFVGHDRFQGLRAYRQLAELYRALRLYVSFFQPSMKLRAKRREGAKVSKAYDPARTPYQRLVDAGVLAEAAAAQLESFHQALDPVRLLRQLGCLQEALWRHATVEGSAAPPDAPSGEGARELTFVHVPVRGAPGTSPGAPEATPAAPAGAGVELPPLKRMYRRTHQPRAPHTWRTRKDPFGAAWEQLEDWLRQEPEITAKGLFQRLQAQSPKLYADGQLRTLQRRVKVWRQAAILTFDAAWLAEERQAGTVLPRPMGATVATDGPEAVNRTRDTPRHAQTSRDASERKEEDPWPCPVGTRVELRNKRPIAGE